MNNWPDAVITPTSSIEGAISVVNATGLQVCLVLDDAGLLLGTVTDGDIRRGLLQSIGIDQPVDQSELEPAVTGPPTGQPANPGFQVVP